jgi:hypothetical protein
MQERPHNATYFTQGYIIHYKLWQEAEAYEGLPKIKSNLATTKGAAPYEK